MEYDEQEYYNDLYEETMQDFEDAQERADLEREKEEEERFFANYLKPFSWKKEMMRE
jgi:hypothetical protein